jgi:hypothetical protein
MCHCLACQKRTGGPFSLQARWSSEQVAIEGSAQEYKLVGDAGSTATFRFCPTCSATVYFDNDTIPGTIAVPVGAFADPTFPPPTISVYGNRRHPWVLVPHLATEELD